MGGKHDGHCHCPVCRGLDRIFPHQGQQLALFGEKKRRAVKAKVPAPAGQDLRKHFVARKGARRPKNPK